MRLLLLNQKQEEALFYPVAVPRLCWNNWNNCGTSSLQKKKNPSEGEWKKKCEEMGIHSM